MFLRPVVTEKLALTERQIDRITLCSRDASWQRQLALFLTISTFAGKTTTESHCF